LCFAKSGSCCRYNVRDIGFVDINPRPYRLYGFIRNDTPLERVVALKQTAQIVLRESNILYKTINIDEEKDHPALVYLSIRNIDSFPSAILVSPWGSSLLLPLSNSESTFKDSLWSPLESSVSSPFRREILKHVVEAYCIVLLVEGKEEEANRKALSVVKNVVHEITGMMTQQIKKIEKPPIIRTLSRNSFMEERTLLWSLDIPIDEIDEPCVAVIYGRGRRIGPVLKGEQITNSRVNAIMSILGLSCECSLDKRWTLGPLIPLKWEEEIRAKIVKHLGFDAESPMVKREITGILSLGSAPYVGDTEIQAFTVNAGSNAMEIFQFDKDMAAARISPARFRELNSPEKPPPQENTILTTLIILGSGSILVVLAVGVFILLRGKWRSS